MPAKEFNPKGVTATLINRVYRTGIAMMVNIDNAKNKGESVDPKVMEDQETDFILSCHELDSMLVSTTCKGSLDPWNVFSETYNKLKDEEKLLFRGVVRDMKEASSNVLSNVAKPFELIIPQEISNFGPAIVEAAGVTGCNKQLFERVYNEAEKMEASAKSTASDIATGAAAVVGTVAAATSTAVSGSAAMVGAAYVAVAAGGYTVGHAVGSAVNDYLYGD